MAGALVRHLWSFAGDGDREDIDQTLLHPEGWYLASSPVITANWKNDVDDALLVPVGGGAGRVFTVGGQTLNAQVQTFYNAVRPDFAPQWSLRVQLAFLFPK